MDEYVRIHHVHRRWMVSACSMASNCNKPVAIMPRLTNASIVLAALAILRFDAADMSSSFSMEKASPFGVFQAFVQK
jgi:hypothetical protein